MIAKIVITHVLDEDRAKPFRITIFNEFDERVMGSRYEESWEAVAAARVIARDWGNGIQIVDTLKQNETWREERRQYLEKRDEMRSDANELETDDSPRGSY